MCGCCPSARLAPEHPFPAAISDVTAALEFAQQHAAELGGDPSAIALGGDSAGGNLSAVVAHQAIRAGRAAPDFLLLLYPACDAAHLARSRHLFAEGFFLTEADIEWFCKKYLPAGVPSPTREHQFCWPTTSPGCRRPTSHGRVRPAAR